MDSELQDQQQADGGYDVADQPQPINPYSEIRGQSMANPLLGIHDANTGKSYRLPDLPPGYPQMNPLVAQRQQQAAAAEMQRPLSQAENLQMQRLMGGLSSVDSELLKGNITQGLGKYLKGQINQALGPLQQRMAATKQKAQQDQINQAMHQQAVQESIAAVGKQARAQDFTKSVATYTDPVTGKTAHMYEHKPGEWKEMEFHSDHADMDRLQETAIGGGDGGHIENWSPTADLAVGQQGGNGESPYPEGLTPQGDSKTQLPDPDVPMPTDLPVPDEIGGDEEHITPDMLKAYQQHQQEARNAVPQQGPQQGQQQPPQQQGQPGFKPVPVDELWRRAQQAFPMPRGRGPGGRFLNPRMAQAAQSARLRQVLALFHGMASHQETMQKHEWAVQQLAQKQQFQGSLVDKRQAAQDARDKQKHDWLQEEHEWKRREAQQKSEHAEVTEASKHYESAWNRGEFEQVPNPDETDKFIKKAVDPEVRHQRALKYVQDLYKAMGRQLPSSMQQKDAAEQSKKAAGQTASQAAADALRSAQGATSNAQ